MKMARASKQEEATASESQPAVPLLTNECPYPSGSFNVVQLRRAEKIRGGGRPVLFGLRSDALFPNYAGPHGPPFPVPSRDT
jgi:hypothetical protein